VKDPPEHVPANYMRGRAECRTAERKPGDVEGEEHRNADPQMVPVGGVVARPYRPDTLGTRKEGPAQHKRPVPIGTEQRLAPLHQALYRRLMVQQAIQVVHLPVLHISKVAVIFWHGYLFSPTTPKAPFSFPAALSHSFFSGPFFLPRAVHVLDADVHNASTCRCTEKWKVDNWVAFPLFHTPGGTFIPCCIV
jgi:hypothetical protein